MLKRILYASALICLSVWSNAVNFNFQFLRPTGQPVGAGYLTLVDNPGLGVAPLASQNFSLEFNLAGIGTFTEQDIFGSIDHVGLLISRTPEGERRLQFTGSGPVFGGALLLRNPAGAWLSFEPAPGERFLIAFGDPQPIPRQIGAYLAIAPDGGSTVLLFSMSACVLFGLRAVQRKSTIPSLRC